MNWAAVGPFVVVWGLQTGSPLLTYNGSYKTKIPSSGSIWWGLGCFWQEVRLGR